MEPNRVTVQLSGTEDQNGDVTVEVFIEQLKALKDALRETDRAIFGSDTVDFLVAELNHSSPALVGLDVCPKPNVEKDNSVAVTDAFYGNFSQVEQHQSIPEAYKDNQDLLHSYKKFSGSVVTEKAKVARLALIRGKDVVQITPNVVTAINVIIGDTKHSFGTASGYLQQINIHRNTNLMFTLYPALSGLPDIKCVFATDLRREVVKSIDMYITVKGRKFYRRPYKYPYRVEVTDIVEVHPPDRDLPTLGSLRGMAPEITGGMSSEDFVRSLRDGWD